MVQANLFDVGVFPGTLYLLHSMENEANQGLLPLFCHESAKSENLNSQQPTSISVFRFSMNLRYHLGSPNFQIFTRLVSCAFHSARHAYHGVNTTNGYFAMSLEIRLFRQYAMLLYSPALESASIFSSKPKSWRISMSNKNRSKRLSTFHSVWQMYLLGLSKRHGANQRLLAAYLKKALEQWLIKSEVKKREVTCWCFLQITKSLGKQINNKKTRWFNNNKKSSSNSTGSRSFTGPLRIQTPGSNSEPSNIAARFQDAWNVAPGRRMDDGPAQHLQRPHVSSMLAVQRNSKHQVPQRPEEFKEFMHPKPWEAQTNESLWGTAIVYSPFSIACHYPLTKASPCGSSASDQGILHRVHVPRSSTLNQSSFHASGETATLALRPIGEKSANWKHNTNWYKPLLEIEVFARRCWLRLVMVCEYFWRLYGNPIASQHVPFSKPCHCIVSGF